MGLLLFLILPTMGPEVVPVDVLQREHVYDERGKKRYEQFVFWIHGDVAAWKLTKDCGPVLHHRGAYVVRLWHGGAWCEVRAACYREDWRQYDGELEQRKMIPPERRRGLSKYSSGPPGQFSE